MIIGGVYDSNNAGKFELLDVYGRKCKIRFIETGYETIKSFWDVKRGEVEDKYIRRIYGIGFIGGDTYLPSENRKHNKSYSQWRDMLRRCYTDHGGIRTSSYSDVSCCDEWHNFQNFAEWILKQPNYNKEGFELDKDLTLFGNRVYSSHACELIPRQLNTVFIGVFDNEDRSLPKGVSKSKTEGYYRIRVRDTLSGKCLTKYGKDPVMLGEVYARLKQEVVCDVVDFYKDCLSERIKENIRNNTEKYLLSLLDAYR